MAFSDGVFLSKVQISLRKAQYSLGKSQLHAKSAQGLQKDVVFRVVKERVDIVFVYFWLLVSYLHTTKKSLI